MVVFDELRITPEGDALFIDLHIRKDLVTEWPDSNIASISICESSKYTEGGVPEGAVEVYHKGEYRVTKYFDKITPGDNIDLPATFKDKLFYVYVTLEGIVETALTCGCSNKNPSIGVALDMGIIYNQFMQYINELDSPRTCSNKTPSGFTDFILRYNAFLLAMDSKHYKKGIAFFDKWFSGKYKPITSGCGCNG